MKRTTRRNPTTDAGAAQQQQAELEQRLTKLAQMLGFMRQQYALLVDRFVAGEVHSQRMNWDQAANHRQAELQQVENILQALEQQT